MGNIRILHPMVRKVAIVCAVMALILTMPLNLFASTAGKADNAKGIPAQAVLESVSETAQEASGDAAVSDGAAESDGTVQQEETAAVTGTDATEENMLISPEKQMWILIGVAALMTVIVLRVIKHGPAG